MIAGLLLCVVLFPALSGTWIRLLAGRLSESSVYRIQLITSAAHSMAFLTLLGVWLVSPADQLSGVQVPLFFWGDRLFAAAFRLDGTGLVFLGLTSFMGGLVTRLSRFYMHREPGFERFYATLQMLVLGGSLLAISDNIETFFAGWEFIGLSSFLLIAFYRHRPLPLRNALKVFALYRMFDIGLLVSVIFEHAHLHRFSFSSPSLADGSGGAALTVMSLLLLLAAAGKSAQVPFTFWLPRAMEGPTPSSAIFYGALSVHAGVFLLLRTHPVWSSVTGLSLGITLVGACTAFLATGIGRVQATIKSQIAYASAAQVGLIFVEVGLGFYQFALFHMVANAILRCYQLLTSPSVVVYFLRRQVTGLHVDRELSALERWLPASLRRTFYVIASQEAFFERYLTLGFWRPLMRSARRMTDGDWALAVIGIFSISFLTFLFVSAQAGFEVLTGFVSLLLALICLKQDRNFEVCLGLGVSSLVLAMISITMHPLEPGLFFQTVPYLVGLGFGYGALAFAHRIRTRDQGRLNWLRFALLASLLGAPLSPLFFAEDLVLDTMFHVSPWALTRFAIVLSLVGISWMRTFTFHYMNERTDKDELIPLR